MNIALIPKVDRRYDRLESTNLAAVDALNAGEPVAHGAVWITADQTAGRGQGGNQWHATPGDNLTLSLVVRPDHLTADRLFALTQWTSLAVARTVAHFLPADLAATVRIKWPNDVYVGKRKIAGILVQNGLRGSQVAWSVIGIGLNVNEASFPLQLISSAIALHLPPGPRLGTDEVLDKLLEHLGTAYPLTDPERKAALNGAYHQLLYLRNQPASYRLLATGEIFTGTIRSVAPSGHLLVELSAGSIRPFALREIAFL